MTPARQQEIERLFRDTGAGIGGYVLARTGDAECAEEITARVFLQVVRNWNQRRGPALPWLWAIVRNELARHYRAMKSWQPLAEDIADRVLPPDAVVERNESAFKLREVMLALSEEEQELLGLKFYLQRSNLEIAAVLGISPSLVGVRLYRLLREMRGKLESRKVETP